MLKPEDRNARDVLDWARTLIQTGRKRNVERAIYIASYHAGVAVRGEAESLFSNANYGLSPRRYELAMRNKIERLAAIDRALGCPEEEEQAPHE